MMNVSDITLYIHIITDENSVDNYLPNHLYIRSIGK